MHRGVAEKDKWGALKLNRHLCMAGGHAITGSYVKRDSGPSPVIDHQPQGDERFSSGISRYSGFRVIPAHSLTIRSALSILPTNAALYDVFGGEWLYSLQDLGLLIADRVRSKRDRRLHGSETEQLKQMVGDHVTQGSRPFEVSSTLFHSYGFSHRNLHVIDVPSIPDWFKQTVAKPEKQDVLHSLFAEVVIDATKSAFPQALRRCPG